MLDQCELFPPKTRNSSFLYKLFLFQLYLSKTRYTFPHFLIYFSFIFKPNMSSFSPFQVQCEKSNIYLGGWSILKEVSFNHVSLIFTNSRDTSLSPSYFSPGSLAHKLLHAFAISHIYTAYISEWLLLKKVSMVCSSVLAIRLVVSMALSSSLKHAWR